MPSASSFSRIPALARLRHRGLLCVALALFACTIAASSSAQDASALNTLRQKAHRLPPVPAVFDPDDALRLLEPGNSALRGRVYIKSAPLRRKYGGHQFVWLVPMTVYAREWVKMNMTPDRDGLKTKDDLPLVQLLLDGKVSLYLARTISEQDGRFAFENLSAGEYILITMSQDVRAQSFQPIVGYDSQTSSMIVDQRCSHGVCSPVYANRTEQVPVYSDKIETVFDVRDYNTVRVVTVEEDKALDLGSVRSKRIR